MGLIAAAAPSDHWIDLGREAEVLGSWTITSLPRMWVEVIWTRLGSKSLSEPGRSSWKAPCDWSIGWAPVGALRVSSP